MFSAGPNPTEKPDGDGAPIAIIAGAVVAVVVVVGVVVAVVVFMKCRRTDGKGDEGAMSFPNAAFGVRNLF